MNAVEAISLWNDCLALAGVLGIEIEMAPTGLNEYQVEIKERGRAQWIACDVTHTWTYLNGVKSGKQQ